MRRGSFLSNRFRLMPLNFCRSCQVTAWVISAAFRSSEKAGYRSFGLIGYIRLGPWRQDFGRVDVYRTSRAGAARATYE